MWIIYIVTLFPWCTDCLDYILNSQSSGDTEGSWEAPQTESASIVGRSTKYPGAMTHSHFSPPESPSAPTTTWGHGWALILRVIFNFLSCDGPVQALVAVDAMVTFSGSCSNAFGRFQPFSSDLYRDDESL